MTRRNLQALEFFVFAGLMLLDIIAFAALASCYKYREEEEEAPVEQKPLDERPDAVAGVRNAALEMPEVGPNSAPLARAAVPTAAKHSELSEKQ